MKEIRQTVDKDSLLHDFNEQNPSGHQNEISEKFLTFWTDNQLFGISIADVVQIVGVQEITQVPEFPEYAKGIINLRGHIIPVLDMRLRLHKEEVPYNERTCIIVINIKENLLGLIVDAVDEVTKIQSQDISNPPKMSRDVTNTYLQGIAKLENKVVLLLDTEKILNNSANLATS